MKELQELINKCAGSDNASDGHHAIRNINRHKTRIGREMRLTTKIGEYEMDQVILYIGLDANVLPK